MTARRHPLRWHVSSIADTLLQNWRTEKLISHSTYTHRRCRSENKKIKSSVIENFWSPRDVTALYNRRLPISNISGASSRTTEVHLKPTGLECNSDNRRRLFFIQQHSLSAVLFPFFLSDNQPRQYTRPAMSSAVMRCDGVELAGWFSASSNAEPPHLQTGTEDICLPCSMPRSAFEASEYCAVEILLLTWTSTSPPVAALHQGETRSNDLAGRSTALAPPCLLLCFSNSVDRR